VIQIYFHSIVEYCGAAYTIHHPPSIHPSRLLCRQPPSHKHWITDPTVANGKAFTHCKQIKYTRQHNSKSIPALLLLSHLISLSHTHPHTHIPLPRPKVFPRGAHPIRIKNRYIVTSHTSVVYNHKNIINMDVPSAFLFHASNIGDMLVARLLLDMRANVNI
jgi:hypothetical protein